MIGPANRELSPIQKVVIALDGFNRAPKTEHEIRQAVGIDSGDRVHQLLQDCVEHELASFERRLGVRYYIATGNGERLAGLLT